MRNHFLISLILLSFALTQNMWEGNSVATSDNPDALFLNPAGLGINRQISSVFFPYYNGEKPFSVKTIDKYNNFGFSTHYFEGDELFNPTGFIIGFGSKVSSNLYSGFSWNKNKIISLGLLYRPLNFLSTGITYQSDEEFKDFCSLRTGLALRPFNGNHKLTIGLDYQYNDYIEKNKINQTIIPFFEIPIIPGLTISAKTYVINDDKSNKINFDNYTINLSLSFGKGGIFSQTGKNNKEGGIGFYTSKSILPSINNFVKRLKSDKKELWVRIKMEGLFIEEPVKKQGFNFNFSIPFFNSGFDGPVIQLRKWTEKLDELSKNDDIDGLIIDWIYIIAGFAKRQEIYNALNRFKKAGKKIIIYSTFGFTNNDYYLVSLADEIYIHEDGGIDLRGFNMEGTFYRELFDTLGIVPEFVAITPYKSAIDGFMRKDFSPEVKENVGGLYHSIYEQFVEGISNGRGWDKNKTKSIINEGPYFNSKIIDNGLITGYKYPDEFDNYIENINEKNIIIKKWEEFNNKKLYDFAWTEKNNPKIAIIYAVGAIIPGESNGGKTGSTTMGDVTIREAIKSAREDKSIDAIVLRIDSPGGSGSASDLIWREIIKTTDKDTANIKPFIASMSDVAASGGYYIACQADTIVAYPSTITGSIGVLGGRINLSGLMNKIGISYDRMVFGDNAAYWSSGKLWSDDEKERFRNLIIDFYGKFVNKVVDGRNHNELDSLKVDSVAGGRVWTGIDAKNHKLVDELGGLNDAIQIAKKAAGINPKQEVDIIEYPKQEPFKFLKLMLETEGNIHIPYPFEEYNEIIELIEVLNADEILYYMPYNIDFN